jgi:hypothetical protein
MVLLHLHFCGFGIGLGIGLGIGFGIGFGIGRKYRPIRVSVSVSGLNQNSGFGRSLAAGKVCDALGAQFVADIEIEDAKELLDERVN